MKLTFEGMTVEGSPSECAAFLRFRETNKQHPYSPYYPHDPHWWKPWMNTFTTTGAGTSTMDYTLKE